MCCLMAHYITVPVTFVPVVKGDTLCIPWDNNAYSNSCCLALCHVFLQLDVYAESHKCMGVGVLRNCPA